MMPETPQAGCAILVRDGTALILRRGQTAPWKPGTWNLPGGTVDKGETPQQCAERELAEEAGIRAKLNSKPVYQHSDEDGWTISYFVAEDSGQQPKLDYENTEFAFVGPDELDQYEWAIPQIGDAIRRALSAESKIAALIEAAAERITAFEAKELFHNLNASATRQNLLVGLEAEARKAGSWENFRQDFTRQIKHGTYWHVTQNKNFTIDTTMGPRDMSSMGDPTPDKGKLMVTSDLEHWADYYDASRAYAALIDMSEVPRKAYWQVGRGFGNEFWVDDPSRAKVVKVLPIKKALELDKKFHSALPGSEDELKAFYERATKNTAAATNVTADPFRNLRRDTQDAMQHAEQMDENVPDYTWHVTKNPRMSPNKAADTADILESAAHRIVALHYTDFMGKTFEQFRSKYSKLRKGGQAHGIFVQFTSHAKDPLDRNAFQNPNHSDPAGVYGYPLDYVLKHPADVWYGQGARYLRVLRNKTSGRAFLDLQNIQEGDAISYLTRIGAKDAQGKEIIRAVDAERWMRATWKKFKNRLGTAGNKVAKIFFMCMQQEGPDKLEAISGPEQSRRFLKLGFRALEDTARSQKQAIINDREPEQIVFLDRTAFEVLETFQLHGRKDDDSRISNTFDTDALDRPTAAKVARYMDDTLTGEKERSNLGGWTYWWTKKGRRIELLFQQSRRHMDEAWNLKWGEKKHRANKLYTPHEAYLVVHTELGDINANVGETEKLSTLLEDFAAQWDALQANPQQTGWTPQSKTTWEEAQKVERSKQAAERNRARNLKEAEYYHEKLESILGELGVPAIPARIAEDEEQVGALSRKLEAIHGTAVENPENLDTVLDAFMDDEPSQEWKPIQDYLRTVWPFLRATYEAHPEDIKRDWIDGYGKPKLLESWLRFVLGKPHYGE
jgi:8-oxo-dGTP diphosphatase